MPPMPAGVQAIFEEMQSMQFASMADAQRFLDRRMEEYNRRPQQELLGLSPEQTSQLMYGDWLERGAMRLHQNLPLGELGGSSVLHNARVFLRYVADRGPLPLTSAENLRRAAVAELLPDLMLPRIERQLLAEHLKVIGERNVHTLSQMHDLLLAIGLIRGRTKLSITPMGREILHDENAGRLYCVLFVAFFGSGKDVPGLDPQSFQPVGAHTPVVMYQLSRHAREWMSEPALCDRCWPAELEEFAPELDGSSSPWRGIAMRFRMLEPLIDFGLLQADGELMFRPTEVPPRYRLTPLFDRFVRFEFTPATRMKQGVHRRRRR
jgi:hypothetical protein